LHRGDGHSFGICHFASSWAEEGGVPAAFRPPSAGSSPPLHDPVSVRLTSGSKRYVVLRALLRISNLLDELIVMPWRVYEIVLVRIHNQQWRFVVPVKVVRIRLAELLQILRRDRFFVGSPAPFNALQ